MTVLSNRWAILGLMFLIGLTLPLQFQAVPALAVFLTAEAQLSYTDIGVLTGLFMLPGTFLAAPIGVIAATIGDRLTLIIGLAVMGGATFAFAMTDSYGVMFASRLLAGAGAVAISVLMPKVITDWFAGKEIATAMAIIASSFGFGVGIAMASLPLIAGPTSWQMAMVLNVVPIGLAIALLLLIYRDRTSVRDTPVKEGLQWSISRAELVLSSIAGLGRGLFASAYVVFMSFLPPLLIAQGIEATQAGLLTSMAAWVSIASVPLGGYLSDRTGKPNYFIVGGSLGAALACVLVPSVAPAILWVVLFGFLRGGCTGGVMALPSQVLRSESRSTGFAIVSATYFICMAAFPPVGGLILDTTGSTAAPLWFAGLLWFLITVTLAVFKSLQHRWSVTATR
jgi:MFS family permease